MGESGWGGPNRSWRAHLALQLSQQVPSSRLSRSAQPGLLSANPNTMSWEKPLLVSCFLKNPQHAAAILLQNEADPTHWRHPRWVTLRCWRRFDLASQASIGAARAWPLIPATPEVPMSRLRSRTVMLSILRRGEGPQIRFHSRLGISLNPLARSLCLPNHAAARTGSLSISAPCMKAALTC